MNYKIVLGNLAICINTVDYFETGIIKTYFLLGFKISKKQTDCDITLIGFPFCVHHSSVRIFD